MMSKTFRELIKESEINDTIAVEWQTGLEKAQALYGDAQASNVDESTFEADMKKIGEEIGADVPAFIVWMKTQMTFKA